MQSFENIMAKKLAKLTDVSSVGTAKHNCIAFCQRTGCNMYRTQDDSDCTGLKHMKVKHKHIKMCQGCFAKNRDLSLGGLAWSKCQFCGNTIGWKQEKFIF